MAKSNNMHFSSTVSTIRGIVNQKANLGDGIARSYSHALQVEQVTRIEAPLFRGIDYKAVPVGAVYCFIELRLTDGRTRRCNVVKGQQATDKGVSESMAKEIWATLEYAALNGDLVILHADNGFNTNNWFCGAELSA